MAQNSTLAGGGVNNANCYRPVTGGRGRLQGKQWSRHHCQYDVTSYISDFQNGAQSCTRRAVKKCRIFFGKTDLFAVVGNAEVSTIIYELYLLFFCEPKTFDSFIVRKKHFTNEKIRRASLLAG